MNSREAKDFLVQQTVEQATLKNVPFSHLERRMMYFTESGDCPEDPIALSDAFETEYNPTVYEKKVSRLMASAYRRIKNENPEKLRLWKEAYRVLSKGDHYILVFWRAPSKQSPRTWLWYVVGVIATAGFYALVLFFFGSKRNMRRGEPTPADRYIPWLSAPPVQHFLQAPSRVGRPVRPLPSASSEG